jgi:type I restriction-modification system DNA methylase subunit
VPGRVSPLKVEDLRGELGEHTNDCAVIMNRISEYLEAKQLPREKRQIIENELRTVFNNSTLYKPEEGVSRLHSIYADVRSNILPYLTGELHNLDFTGRMFNVLNAWVDVPDGAENDVVLTPRYVTELMAKICDVNMDSYVWDFATGSGGFLISAMHEMIADAKRKIKSPAELDDKIAKIKMTQLLGIETHSQLASAKLAICLKKAFFGV